MIVDLKSLLSLQIMKKSSINDDNDLVYIPWTRVVSMVK